VTQFQNFIIFLQNVIVRSTITKNGVEAHLPMLFHYQFDNLTRRKKSKN